MASVVILAGTVTNGGIVSCTVTVKFAVAGLPELSAAEQCTVVTPIENVPPDARSHDTDATPEPPSVAVAAANDTAATPPAADCPNPRNRLGAAS